MDAQQHPTTHACPSVFLIFTEFRLPPTKKERWGLPGSRCYALLGIAPSFIPLPVLYHTVLWAASPKSIDFALHEKGKVAKSLADNDLRESEEFYFLFVNTLTGYASAGIHAIESTGCRLARIAVFA